jgi:hypothetical protein
MRHRRALSAVAVAVALVLAVSACGSDGSVQPDLQSGRGGRTPTVLAEEHALPVVRAAIDPFLGGKRGRVSSGGGSATDVATTVKDGYRIDVVVLPAGAGLERVREELLLPPARLGTLAGTEYWAAVITARGLPFWKFLTGARGMKVLRAHGFT